MDRWGICHLLNSQEHRCQNSWKSLLINGPKMGAGPILQDSLIPSGPNFGGQASVFNKVIPKVNYSHIRLHDLRHTHASLLLHAGVHPRVVQECLGHSSIRVTLDTYSHVIGGLQEAAA
jgi:integrase